MNWRWGGKEIGGTYKLEIGLQAPHNKPDSLGRHQIGPLLTMSRVDVHREVGDPVDTCRLRVPVVVDVVYMALLDIHPKHVSLLIHNR